MTASDLGLAVVSGRKPVEAVPLSGREVEDLLVRLRAGDRNAAAAFIERNREIIRQRFRRKLGRAMRRVVDSYDVVSTIARRLDTMLTRGGLGFENERQLWGLVMRLGDRAVADKARLLARLKRAEQEERDWADTLAAAIERSQSDGEAELSQLLDRAFGALENDVDRTILAQWLHGHSQAQMAVLLEMEAGLVRKRWERIRACLRAALGGEPSS